MQIADLYKIEIAPRHRNLKETLRIVLRGGLVELGILLMPLENTSGVEKAADGLLVQTPLG